MRVELVGPTGNVIPTSIKGFQGIQGGSLVTVKGKVVRGGKDNKNWKIEATKFFPG